MFLMFYHILNGFFLLIKILSFNSITCTVSDFLSFALSHLPTNQLDWGNKLQQ